MICEIMKSMIVGFFVTVLAVLVYISTKGEE